MEIIKIENKDIWEGFLLNHSPQSFFQSWDWGEIIKKSQGKKADFIGRFGIKKGNKLIGIFQAQKILARRGSFLHLRHGPVLSNYDSETLDFLTKSLKDLCRKEKTSFVRMSPLIAQNSQIAGRLTGLGFRNAPIQRLDGEFCWVLDLGSSEEELLAGMRKTTRYLIRWSVKNNVRILKSKNIKDLDDFFKLYELTSKRHHFVKHGGIREEFEILLKENAILLFQGFHQDRLLSSALIIFYGDQAIYHHSASIEQKIPVNYLLQWEAIKEAKKRGMKVYNFWGIAPIASVDHPWKNITVFKTGFGGRVLEYQHCLDLPVNKISYLRTFIVELARKKLKGF